MIKDLEGKNTFYYLDPIYTKYFVTRKITLNEQEKLANMRHLLFDFTEKVYGENVNLFSYNGYHLGYMTNFGYYLSSNADRGFYNIDNFGLDDEKAFKKIIIELLFGLAIDYEMNNRAKLNEDFNKRFALLNIEYSTCLSFAEYSLRMLNKYYANNIPEDIILYFENYLNKNIENITWTFDTVTLSFNATPNIKENRRLIK